MELVNVNIVCDQCNKINTEVTGHIPGYHKTILKSFWCAYCKKPQVIRFKFTGKDTEVVERIEPSTVYIQRDPDVGITIRPRAKRQR